MENYRRPSKDKKIRAIHFSTIERRKKKAALVKMTEGGICENIENEPVAESTEGPTTSEREKATEDKTPTRSSRAKIGRGNTNLDKRLYHDEMNRDGQTKKK